jgi:hypothetical protein
MTAFRRERWQSKREGNMKPYKKSDGLKRFSKSSKDSAGAGVRQSSLVVVLVTLLAALGLIDLVLTTAYMTTDGMFESNPIVVWVMGRTHSVLALVAFKLLFLAIGAGSLLAARRHWTGAAGAWIGIAINFFVMANWIMYAQVSKAADLNDAASHASGWVRLAK